MASGFDSLAVVIELWHLMYQWLWQGSGVGGCVNRQTEIYRINNLVLSDSRLVFVAAYKCGLLFSCLNIIKL